MHYLKLILFVLFFSSLNVNQASAVQPPNTLKSVNERLDTLEKVINSPNPLAHDIGLRRELEGTIQNQNYLNQRIDKIDMRLEELTKLSNNLLPSLSPMQIDSILQSKISDIRAEILSIIDLTKTQNIENQKILVESSKNALSSASQSAADASKTLDSFFIFLTVVISLFGLLGAFIAYSSYTLRLHAIEAAKDAKNAKEMSVKLRGDIKKEIGELTIIKKELLLMHKMVDLKDAYRLYLQQRKVRKVDHLKSHIYRRLTDLISGYRHVENAWKKFTVGEDKKAYLEEIKDNLSYCFAVEGVLLHHDNNVHEAADKFELAYLYNVSGFMSRIFNFGYACSLRHMASYEQTDLDKLVACYCQLSKYSGEREHFIKDSDIEKLKIKPILDAELKKIGKEVLIV